MASSCRKKTPTPTPTRRRPKASSSSPRRAAGGGRVHGAGAGDRNGGRVRAEQPIRSSRRPRGSPSPTVDADRATRPAAAGARFPSRRRSPIPPGRHDQLERVEHMRVSVASLTVTGPSGGSVDETAATGTSNGRFLRRRHRRGASVPRAGHSGAGPAAERQHPADSALGLQPGAHRRDERGDRRAARPHRESGDIVAPLVGPLDYASRTYAILLDGTSTAVDHAGHAADDGSAPAGNEVTVASVNLRRFFDTIDDPSVADVGADARGLRPAVSPRPRLRFATICGIPTSSACRRSRRSAC